MPDNVSNPINTPAGQAPNIMVQTPTDVGVMPAWNTATQVGRLYSTPDGILKATVNAQLTGESDWEVHKDKFALTAATAGGGGGNLRKATLSGGGDGLEVIAAKEDVGSSVITPEHPAGNYGLIFVASFDGPNEGGTGGFESTSNLGVDVKIDEAGDGNRPGLGVALLNFEEEDSPGGNHLFTFGVDDAGGLRGVGVVITTVEDILNTPFQRGAYQDAFRTSLDFNDIPYQGEGTQAFILASAQINDFTWNNPPGWTRLITAGGDSGNQSYKRPNLWTKTLDAAESVTLQGNKQHNISGVAFSLKPATGSSGITYSALNGVVALTQDAYDYLDDNNGLDANTLYEIIP